MTTIEDRPACSNVTNKYNDHAKGEGWGEHALEICMCHMINPGHRAGASRVFDQQI